MVGRNEKLLKENLKKCVDCSMRSIKSACIKILWDLIIGPARTVAADVAAVAATPTSFLSTARSPHSLLGRA